jgi:hypothetical protein
VVELCGLSTALLPAAGGLLARLLGEGLGEIESLHAGFLSVETYVGRKLRSRELGVST